MAEKRWQRGDTVMFRYPPEARMVRAYQAERKDPVVHVLGRPHIVLEDTDERVALYMPEGATVWRWNLGANHPRPPRQTQGESVQLLFPGQRYAVDIFYDAGSGPGPTATYYFPGVKGRFLGWKVDICSPFARSEAGFDMIDEVLDICVRPDRSFDWRDETDMEQFVAIGIYTAAEAEEFRRVGLDVIEMVKAHAPPFDDEWQTWRPALDLILGEVPEGWPYAPLPEPYRSWDGPLE
jgi:hypothetical protein